MAILSALKLTDIEDLRSEANAFEGHAEALKTTTDQMLALIEDSVSVFKSEDSDKYRLQFDGLRDDMQKIYDMCKEYSDDLLQIAQNYQRAQDDNVSLASALKADIELK